MIQSLEIFFDGFAWVKDDVVVYTLPNISKTIQYIIDQDGQRSRRHLTKGPPSVLEKTRRSLRVLPMSSHTNAPHLCRWGFQWWSFGKTGDFCARMVNLDVLRSAFAEQNCMDLFMTHGIANNMEHWDVSENNQFLHNNVDIFHWIMKGGRVWKGIMFWKCMAYNILQLFQSSLNTSKFQRISVSDV